MSKHLNRIPVLGMIALTIVMLLPSATRAEPITNLFDFFQTTKQPSKTTDNNGYTEHENHVAKKIAKKLRDLQLHGYNIEVEFRDGVASLLGQVGDSAQIKKAEEAIWKIPDVKQVINRLKLTSKVDKSQPLFQPHALVPTSPNNGWPKYATTYPTNYPTGSHVGFPKQYQRNSFPFNNQPYCSLIGQFYPYTPKPIGWRSCSLEWNECEKYELTFNPTSSRTSERCGETVFNRLSLCMGLAISGHKSDRSFL